MAHEAKLNVEGKKYNLIECTYELVRPADPASAQLRGGVQCGKISFTVVSPPDNDMFFHEWIEKSNAAKDGQIDIKVVDLGSITDRTLYFKHAFCTRIYESFYMHMDKQMYTMIDIIAAEVAFGGDDNKVTITNDLKKAMAN